MRRVRFLCVLVALFAVASPAFAQDMEAGKPDQHHTYLEPMVGTWDVTVRFWTSPIAEPMSTKGTAEHKLIMGGRFLQQDFKGDMMGMPFEGLSWWGYDKAKKMYVSVWIDNTSTTIMTTWGTDDGTGKNFTFTGEYVDPTSGQTKKMKEVVRVVDPNKHTMEMFDVTEGKEVKSMEIEYTRK